MGNKQEPTTTTTAADTGTRDDAGKAAASVSPAERFEYLKRKAEPATDGANVSPLSPDEIIELGFRCASASSDGAALQPFVRVAGRYLGDAVRVIPAAAAPPEGIGAKDGPAFDSATFESGPMETAPNLTSPHGGSAAEYVGTHDADGNPATRDPHTGQAVRAAKPGAGTDGDSGL